LQKKAAPSIPTADDGVIVENKKKNNFQYKRNAKILNPNLL
jgi:hypothetical protein